MKMCRQKPTIGLGLEFTLTPLRLFAVDSQIAISLHLLQALVCALLKQMGVSTKTMVPFDLELLAGSSSSHDRFAAGLELSPCSGSFQSLDAHHAALSFSVPSAEVFIVKGNTKLVRCASG